MVLSAVGVLLLFALAEVLLVRWTIHAVKGRPLKASLHAGAIRAIGLLGVLLVVDSPLLGIAAILGDMVGSYVAVGWEPGEEEDDDGSEDFDSEEA